MHIHAQSMWTQFGSGSCREVDLVESLNHKSYRNFYPKAIANVNHTIQKWETITLSKSGKRSNRGKRSHYPKVNLVRLAIFGEDGSKRGKRSHYPKVNLVRSVLIFRWDASDRNWPSEAVNPKFVCFSSLLCTSTMV